MNNKNFSVPESQTHSKLLVQVFPLSLHATAVADGEIGTSHYLKRVLDQPEKTTGHSRA